MDIEILILNFADDSTQNGYTSKVIFNSLKRLQEGFDRINDLFKISFDITFNNEEFTNIQPLNDLIKKRDSSNSICITRIILSWD